MTGIIRVDNVNNYRWQIVNLARTTLRNIIGTLTLKSANSERDKINGELLNTLSKETKTWGMQIVRTELKEIDPNPTFARVFGYVTKKLMGHDDFKDLSIGDLVGPLSDEYKKIFFKPFEPADNIEDIQEQTALGMFLQRAVDSDRTMTLGAAMKYALGRRERYEGQVYV